MYLAVNTEFTVFGYKKEVIVFGDKTEFTVFGNKQRGYYIWR